MTDINNFGVIELIGNFLSKLVIWGLKSLLRSFLRTTLVLSVIIGLTKAICS